MLENIAIFAILGFFFWVVTTGRKSTTIPGFRFGKKAQRTGEGMAGRGTTSDRHLAQNMGGGTGLMGGDIADASVSRYALSRTKKDPNSSDARDQATSIGMQSGIDIGG